MGRTVSELIPYSVVARLRNKLSSSSSSSSSFLDDFGRIYGVADELERIKSSIECIESVLFADAVGLEEGGKAVQQWIRTLKHVLLPADDLFDYIATQNLHLLPPNRLRDKVRSFFSSLSPLRIAYQVKKIQKDVNDVVQRMPRLNLNLSHAESENETESARARARARRVTNSNSLLSDHIIGRDYEGRQCFLIHQLMMQPLQNDDVNVSLIALVGLGGIGKTTLAQMLYNDEQLQGFYEKRMWVCVSHNFDVKNIAEQLTGDKINDQHSLQDSLNKLRASLNGTRYLLVLDDVWNESPEIWTQLTSYLMCGAQGSKILVTTRSKIVAQVMGASFVFHLKGLGEEVSWSLLKMLTFTDDDDDDDYDYLLKERLEWVGKLIVKRCRGVPLAIKTAAGVLQQGKYEQLEWFSALNGDLWCLGEENDSIMPTLRLSYQHLPPQLKECFAYCSLYPKGWEIKKNELIQLWMAQGYLQCSNDKQQMEDVGNELVDILLKKSFFQEEKFDEYGNLFSFKLHELMYDLALLVADNDFHLDKKTRVNPPLHIRFSREYNNVDLSGNSLDASRLRTFYLQRKTSGGFTHMTRELSFILSFKSLRVLNLSHSSLKKLPSLIGRLQHLRYLDLSWCVELASLPESMGNLVNLQTLKLTGCKTLEFSTEVVTKLVNLRHLEIHRCKALEGMMPAGLGKLSSLQSLTSFHVVDDKKKKAGKLNELQNLNNLRGNLEINGLDQVRDVMLESRDVNLEDKKLLQSLDLNWGYRANIGDSLQLLENLRPHQHLKRLKVGWYPGERFSNWLSSIQHLSYISLHGFDSCKYLPPLEELPYLKSLMVGSMKVLEYIHVSPSAVTFFQSLEVLKFYSCAKLRGWKRMEDDASLPPFPRLCQLVIRHCPKLACLPTFPSVEELQLCETRVKPLRETLDMVSSSSSTTPLSMLKSLTIHCNLFGINYLPSEFQQNLTSLEYLEIGGVEKLEIWFEGGFPCLRNILIRNCNSKALPDKLCDSLSLTQIKIAGCHKLASLPQGMSRLKKLVTLEIFDCPLLVVRCLRDTGADWPKISHVQNVILMRQIEWQSRY